MNFFLCFIRFLFDLIIDNIQIIPCFFIHQQLKDNLYCWIYSIFDQSLLRLRFIRIQLVYNLNIEFYLFSHFFFIFMIFSLFAHKGFINFIIEIYFEIEFSLYILALIWVWNLLQSQKFNHKKFLFFLSNSSNLMSRT